MLNQNNDSIENEIFKDIPGYEGLYQVSNQGRVKSLKRKGRRSDKILRPNNSLGYLRVYLRRDKKPKNITIHKLVMLTFVGKCPDGLEINHIDGNKENNHIDNLEYCTHSENAQHAFDNGLNVNDCGEKARNAKLTRKQVLEIRARYKAGGITQAKLGREYGVDHRTINYIVNRINWTHI